MQKINKNIDHIAVIDTKTKKCFRCHKNDVNYLSGRFQGVNSTYFWTSKQLKLLKENFENKTNTEILNLIKLPLNVIKNKAKFFKLKRSEKIKTRNLSESLKGRIFSDEWKKKISESYKLRSKESYIGKNNGMYGKIPWNKGLTSETDKRVKKIGIKNSITKKQNWDNLTEKERLIKKNILREQFIPRLSKMNLKKTFPEILFEEFLKNLNIEFEYNKTIDYYRCDFVLSKNVIIEIQGDYWHANPRIYNENNYTEVQIKNIRRDKAKKTFLKNKGYKIFYFWEYDIKKKPNLCIKKLEKIKLMEMN